MFVKIRIRAWGVLGVAITLLAILQGRASAASEEVDRDRAQRESAIESTIRQVSKEASAPDLGAPVTYDQILADPDNIDLNFRWAKTQVAQGDLKGASATLERIMLIRPDLLDIKLFYALVLMRLDNLDEAEQALLDLKSKPLPEPAQRQIAQSLREIQHQRRRTHFSASSSMGFGIDSNRNAAPASKKQLFADVELPLTGTSRKRRDTNVLFLQDLTVTRDLDRQAHHQLTGSFDYFLGEQTVVDELDLSSYTFSVGSSHQMPWLNVSPKFKHEVLLLSRETYLRSDELGLSVNRALGRRMQLRGEGGWARDDYDGINENPLARDRKGDRWNAGGGASLILTQAMRLDFDAAFEQKDAKLPYNAYDGVTFDWRHTWLLGHGQFFITALTHELDSYHQPDYAISNRNRQDKSLRVRFTYGLPVGLVVGRWLPASVVKDLTASTSIEQYRAVSTIQSYTYTNTKWSLLLTKTVEF